jgi:hypothetical protein
VTCGNQLRFQRVAFVLKFPALRPWSIAYSSELDPVDRADRKRRRSNHFVVNNFRHLGTAFTETDVEQADLETVITDLMSPVQRPGSRGRIQHRRALG